MLKRGDHDPAPAELRDRCLFGKVTEWWNLTKRMRHFMDLRKHMWVELFEPLCCDKLRETNLYQRWMRFIWGWIWRSAFTVTRSKAVERAQTICEVELFKPLHLKAKGQCLWSDLFRQNSRDGCWSGGVDFSVKACDESLLNYATIHYWGFTRLFNFTISFLKLLCCLDSNSPQLMFT